VQIEGKLSAKGKVSDVPYIYSSRSVLLSLTIFSVKQKKKKNTLLRFSGFCGSCLQVTFYY
jgi:hypothetical protein